MPSSVKSDPCLSDIPMTPCRQRSYKAHRRTGSPVSTISRRGHIEGLFLADDVHRQPGEDYNSSVDAGTESDATSTRSDAASSYHPPRNSLEAGMEFAALGTFERLITQFLSSVAQESQRSMQAADLKRENAELSARLASLEQWALDQSTHATPFVPTEMTDGQHSHVRPTRRGQSQVTSDVPLNNIKNDQGQPQKRKKRVRAWEYATGIGNDMFLHDKGVMKTTGVVGKDLVYRLHEKGSSWKNAAGRGIAKAARRGPGKVHFRRAKNPTGPVPIVSVQSPRGSISNQDSNPLGTNGGD